MSYGSCDGIRDERRAGRGVVGARGVGRMEGGAIVCDGFLLCPFLLFLVAVGEVSVEIGGIWYGGTATMNQVSKAKGDFVNCQDRPQAFVDSLVDACTRARRFTRFGSVRFWHLMGDRKTGPLGLDTTALV